MTVRVYGRNNGRNLRPYCCRKAFGVLYLIRWIDRKKYLRPLKILSAENPPFGERVLLLRGPPLPAGVERAGERAGELVPGLHNLGNRTTGLNLIAPALPRK